MPYFYNNTNSPVITVNPIKNKALSQPNSTRGLNILGFIFPASNTVVHILRQIEYVYFCTPFRRLPAILKVPRGDE